MWGEGRGGVEEDEKMVGVVEDDEGMVEDDEGMVEEDERMVQK